jgi:hypothetical protein
MPGQLRWIERAEKQRQLDPRVGDGAPLSQVEEKNAEITVVLLIRGPHGNSSLIASCYANCIAHFCKVSGRVSAHPPFPELGLLDFQANAACSFSASQFASAGNAARAIRRYCEGALEQFWFDRRATVNG